MNDAAYAGFEGQTDSVFISIDGVFYEIPFGTLRTIMKYAQKDHDEYCVRHW